METTILLIAVAAIGLFFVLREFFLWYWKVNETVKELKSINLNLVALLNHYGVQPPVLEIKKEIPIESKSTKQPYEM